MLTISRIQGDISGELNTKIENYLPCKNHVIRSATGRSLINNLINKLGISKVDSVLLPAYVPEGLLHPLIRNHINILYYKLDQQLFPDLDHLSDLISSNNRIKLCFVIHPMGFEAPISEISSLLKINDIFLVEDCAQGLFSKYNNGGFFGEEGTFSLFSLNKFLPICDGAFLLSDLDIMKPKNHLSSKTLEKGALDAYHKHLNNNRIIRDSIYQNDVKELIKQSSNAYDQYYTFIDTDLSIYRISNQSIKTLSCFDIDSLIENRRNNVIVLYEKLNSRLFQFLYPKYNENIIPMAIPVIVNEKRQKVIEELMCRNILPSIQDNKWNVSFIRKNKDHFIFENDFIERHLLIPIAEHFTKDEMLYLANSMNSL